VYDAILRELGVEGLLFSLVSLYQSCRRRSPRFGYQSWLFVLVNDSLEKPCPTPSDARFALTLIISN
jgi:hypothetical protein